MATRSRGTFARRLTLFTISGAAGSACAELSAAFPVKVGNGITVQSGMAANDKNSEQRERDLHQASLHIRPACFWDATMSDLDLMPPPLLELRDRSVRLAAALSATAKRLREQSEVPAADLLTELRDFSQRFAEAAAQLQPDGPVPVSVLEMERCFQSRQQTRRALGVLDRVEAIRHVEGREVAALQAARKLAWELRRELEEDDRTCVRQCTAEVLQEHHPLRAVLTLVTDDARLDDQTWDALHEIVTQAFGRELATAIARRKLKCQGPDKE